MSPYELKGNPRAENGEIAYPGKVIYEICVTDLILVARII